MEDNTTFTSRIVQVITKIYIMFLPFARAAPAFLKIETALMVCLKIDQQYIATGSEPGKKRLEVYKFKTKKTQFVIKIKLLMSVCNIILNLLIIIHYVQIVFVVTLKCN